MSNSSENSSKWREPEAKLEELSKSIMDVLAGFRNMEREIKLGMVGLAQEMHKLDSSLKNIRLEVKGEVKKQVDEYLKLYLKELPNQPTIHSRTAFSNVAPTERPKSSKSTVPPPRYRRSGS